MSNNSIIVRLSYPLFIRHACLLVLSALAVNVLGCQKPTVDEVDVRLADIHATTTPIPMPKQINGVRQLAYYEAKSNPFATPRAVVFSKQDLGQGKSDGMQSQNGLNTSADADAKKVSAMNQTAHLMTPNGLSQSPTVGRQVHIQTNRIRQELERYPMSTLRYQGFIEQNGQRIALITSADGLVHRVQVGQYVGQNHGQVRQVGRDFVVIAEAMMQADGRYYEQTHQLPLTH
ncbi:MULTISPECIES: pilus assembly protein PilP [unclassified Moraxella]|uniref:pilus assembly protein PilP n=1 Tax=unclassified Moraxella TaxID=2685852 RepID=UPI00359E56FF